MAAAHRLPFICSSCLRSLRKEAYHIDSTLKFSAKALYSSTATSSYQSDQPIRIIREVQDLRDFRKILRKHEFTQGHGTLGFVPTLGALHEGHLELARTAAAENDEVIVSIYLNPAQFGRNEDLDTYPRTFDSDMTKLQSLNDSLSLSSPGRITAVFAPTTKTMYPTLPPTSDPEGHGSFVNITPMSNLLEGASRPIFFRGVATVCMKLFNLVQATRVYFGQKDAQQVAIIKRMVRDFHIDTDVRICPTMREPDGLALSSRNVYLGERRRKASLALIRMLRSIEGRYKKEAMRTRDALLEPYERMAGVVQKRGEAVPGHEVSYVVDYVSLADRDSMEEVDVVDPEKGAVLSAAMLMLSVEDLKEGEDMGEAEGVKRTVRLIDNIVLPPLGSK